MTPIYYQEHGEGQVLVLIHGFCESHEIWEKLIPDLSRHFKVITLDLPGFGKSQLPKNSFTIKEIGHVVIELLEFLGITKCLAIGHSLGGYVALALAKEKPDLLAGLCLFH